MTRPPVIRVGSSRECPLVGAMRGLLPIIVVPGRKNRGLTLYASGRS